MLKLIHLTKHYGDRTVVNDLNLHVQQGEVLGLLGPNGAGKSTTVSMISSLLSPNRGEIWIGGHNLAAEPRAAKQIMGIVPQDIALYDTLSAKDNLSLFGSLYGLSGAGLRRKVDEVLEMVGLLDKKNQDVREFSGGMKRRVNIGAALMNDPQLLILDEPTVGIDPQSRNHILETVKRLNQERRMTVIYTSHYMEEVEYLCSRVAIMDHGQLIALGTKEQLKQQLGAWDMLSVDYEQAGSEALEKVELIQGVVRMMAEPGRLTLFVNPKEQNAIHILEALKGLGLTLTSFRYDEVNLEHLFLQATGRSLRD
ncbi:export ABC transporter ATP-binding protein [Paenibacillus sp. CAA11]|uniref:ABC transporter ATP-binding protein n=1 Tax=Paenibacillus sp. CAA11 TaxID=1532905 RepID=UPI000D37189C|nr:ABC transporter ATP-binding protein [Paenibacillus sp. CAA11]AWB43759.1 export ABC transporter ATP-binding protein [Paenibacillus sp. CAA11]